LAVFGFCLGPFDTSAIWADVRLHFHLGKLMKCCPTAGPLNIPKPFSPIAWKSPEKRQLDNANCASEDAPSQEPASRHRKYYGWTGRLHALMSFGTQRTGFQT
jgi:hypothetical protein